MTKLAIALVLLASACGGKSRKPEQTTTTATVAASADVQLELAEMKLIDVKSQKAVLLHANGEIEIENGVKPVKVTKDGKMVNQAGEVGFTLKPDGTILGPDGKALEITLSADAVIKSGDKSISIDATGALIGSNPEAGEMKIEGADTPGKKRTALFVLIALTATTGAAEPAPTTGGGAK